MPRENRAYDDINRASSDDIMEAAVKLMAEAMALKKLEDLKPVEPQPLDGRPPVIRFWKQWPGPNYASPTEKTYEWAAVGVYSSPSATRLKWYVTNSATWRYWDDLMEWIGPDHWMNVEVLYGEAMADGSTYEVGPAEATTEDV